jgi:hypothetical protein
VNSREKSLADMESDLIGIKEMRALHASLSSIPNAHPGKMHKKGTVC